MADIFQKCHHDLLEEVKRRGIYPYFHTLESRQAPVVNMEGKRRIMLGSNNYLGFTEDPVVIEAGHKALDKYGTGVSDQGELADRVNAGGGGSSQCGHFAKTGGRYTGTSAGAPCGI